MSEQRRFGVSEFATNADRFEAYEELCDRLESQLTAEREAKQRAEASSIATINRLTEELRCVVEKRMEAEQLLKSAKESEQCWIFNAKALQNGYNELDARIKAIQEQEPVAYFAENYSAIAWVETDNCVSPLYPQPVIPPEVAELQRENAELRETASRIIGQHKEICNLLEEAKRQAVPEGMGDAIDAMNEAKLLPVWDSINHELHKRIDVIFRFLSAAPQPEKKD